MAKRPEHLPTDLKTSFTLFLFPVPLPPARKMRSDGFGFRSEDWDLYKEIDPEGGASESEEENADLDKVESVLKEFDVEFSRAEALGTGSVFFER